MAKTSLPSLVLAAAGAAIAAAFVPSAACAADRQPPAPATQPVELVYIMSPNCEKCQQAGPIVESAANKFGGRVRLIKLNVLDVDDLNRVLDIEDRLKLPAAPPPRVIVGSRCLTGLDEIRQKLGQTLAELAPPAASQPEDIIKPPASQPE